MLTDEAANWYKEEFDGETSLRFFARYGGNGNIPGFSLGVKPAIPVNMHASVEKEDTLFFIEEDDAWYFEGADLYISYDEVLEEPAVSYQKK
ncbi:hypothetical protein P5G51_010595 [Virgibacillus sp. 179-BFC.A HS]|uniref:HesB/YadR/YfhF family protein n=1 Tax=Tigheibacillus jepli TaxID=3035914 RepID=A0ABU5CIZ3_9BACI|nr:hypothetical protein [Virgibacillus sp. 179-BFC.A HS]MDY0405779.1 hypothetical protein [Virgibacillus sp. 179-BFC.A HS]